MLIIGICGASGSGKSTLAKALASRLERPCVYIKQDSYYKDHPDMTYEQRCLINYDEPEAYKAFLNAITSLVNSSISLFRSQ